MILVSILGDFHSSILPISYEFKEQIRKHIIVYDDARNDIKKSWRVLRGQKAFMKSLSSKSKDKYEIVSMQIDEDSYVSIENCFERIMDMTKSTKDIYLNTTDGLSSVALVLSSKFLSVGAKVLAYDKHANTYNLHTNSGMEKCVIKNNSDIQNHLLLKGYEILKVPQSLDLLRRKEVVYKLAENLTRYKEFANLRQHKSADMISGYKDYKTLLQSVNKLDNQYFIQGTVFEEYIYHLIVDNFDFDDVMTGVKVQFEEAVENEFDILMIKDNHLHTIECKFKRDLDGEPFVYKTELIKDYLDDDGKAMILNIGGDNENFNKGKFGEVKFSRGDKARAHYGDIAIHQSKEFNEKAFLRAVREWFL